VKPAALQVKKLCQPSSTMNNISVRLTNVFRKLSGNIFSINGALLQKPKFHQRQLVDGSDPTYKSDIGFASLIPPTAVGGYFRSSLVAAETELGGI